ncbi:hypothetical protein VKT23_012847 [Stygiomarasmius scandens]|uniref:Uncharacterized protein n=1 Tax=Marasmiellus scandens TaxID=2682957 RepID=A0ABR1J760_9AGAR
MPPYKFSRRLFLPISLKAGEPLQKVKLAYSRNARYLAAIANRQMTLWDAHTYDTKAIFVKESSDITGLYWLSIDPNILISSDSKGRIFVSYLLTHTIDTVWFRSGNPVTTIAANSAETLLALATNEPDTTEIWALNINRGPDYSSNLNCHMLGLLPSRPTIGGVHASSTVSNLHFLNDDNLLVAYQDGAVITWSISRDNPHVLAYHIDSMRINNGLLQDISPDFATIAVAEAPSYKIYTFPKPVPDEVFDVPQSSGPTSSELASMLYVHDGTQVLGTGIGKTVLWHALSGRRLQTLSYPERESNCPVVGLSAAVDITNGYLKIATAIYGSNRYTVSIWEARPSFASTFLLLH